MIPPTPQEAGAPFLQKDTWNNTVLREQIVRAYIPIATRYESDEVDLVVKIYHDKDASNSGEMTRTIDLASMGSLIELKGLIGNFEYKGQGNCNTTGRDCYTKRFIMISGGSGIPPMIQILRAIAADVSDLTECLLLSGNRCEDILCKIQLDTLAKENTPGFV
ncbi:Nitrate reductase [Fusarium agapanthi]|uniref:Nitrate reductase n=1 Tax=Fusarium agapanthi TaxID=1803897 RepID=A0A9P5BA54_9HYPO|nr:Nitrate reductase [Fusarium agapanthi]